MWPLFEYLPYPAALLQTLRKLFANILLIVFFLELFSFKILKQVLVTLQGMKSQKLYMFHEIDSLYII